VFALSLAKKVRVRFDARTIFIAPVRATINVHNWNAGSGECVHNVGVDALDFFQAQQTVGYAALVRHNEQRKLIRQQPQRRDGLRVEHHVTRVAQPAAVFDEYAIAIEKHRRAITG
jgi:hypothetical protein